MDAIEELIARDKIRQLAERYALAVDGRDIEGIAALFMADVDNGRYGSGRDGVAIFFDNALRGLHCTIHIVANHVIDFDDDHHAHGTLYCHARHHVLEPDHWWDKAIAYADTYERVGDEWFFRRRSTRGWYRQEFGHPEHGTQRVVLEVAADGPSRGLQMPHAFRTFDAYWAREPRPLPN